MLAQTMSAWATISDCPTGSHAGSQPTPPSEVTAWLLTMPQLASVPSHGPPVSAVPRPAEFGRLNVSLGSSRELVGVTWFDGADSAEFPTSLVAWTVRV